MYTKEKCKNCPVSTEAFLTTMPNTYKISNAVCSLYWYSLNYPHNYITACVTQ